MKRNSKVYTIVRIILGIILLPNAFIGFFLTPEEMGLTKEAVTIVDQFWETGYLMQVVKGLEFLAGMMFLTNQFTRLAPIIIMPVLVNIFLLATFKDPSGLILAIVLLFLNLYVIVHHWESYQKIFRRK